MAVLNKFLDSKKTKSHFTRKKNLLVQKLKFSDFFLFQIKKMCSLAEGDLLFDSDAETLSECSTEKSECSTTTCKKCRIADAVLTLRTKDRYCRDCFVVAVTHKFRSTLGKNRVMRHGNLDILWNLVCSSLRKVLNLHQEREFFENRHIFKTHFSYLLYWHVQSLEKTNKNKNLNRA